MAKTFATITRKQMRDLQPGERITEHGITFQRLANGDGLFSVNVMVDGKRIHRHVGREFGRNDADDGGGVHCQGPPRGA